MKPTVSLFHVNIGLNGEQYMLKQPRILTVFEILGHGGLLQMLCFRWKGRLKIFSVILLVLNMDMPYEFL